MKSDPGNFGWVSFDDLDQFSESKEESWNIDEMAFITVSLEKSKANPRRALAKARRKFIDIAEIKPAYVKKINILRQKEITLFTSIQVEYEIQIVADPHAVTHYYYNKENS